MYFEVGKLYQIKDFDEMARASQACIGRYAGSICLCVCAINSVESYLVTDNGEYELFMHNETRSYDDEK